MFKVGDKVKCINNEGFDICLNYNQIYEILTIEKYVNDLIFIKNNTNFIGWFDPNRFELVKEEKQSNNTVPNKFKPIEKEETKKKKKFVPMDELEVISVNGIDGILISE